MVLKIIKGILIAGFAILLAFFPSCQKEKITVTKIDTVLVSNTIATFYAVRDASIFSTKLGVESLYTGNGSGASQMLRVGFANADGSNYYARTLVAFDVSSIPAGVEIVSATLSFAVAQSGTVVKSVSVYKVTESWNEGTTNDACNYSLTCSSPGTSIDGGNDVTWNYRQYATSSWTTEGGSFAGTASASVTSGAIALYSSPEMANDVKSWMTTPANNFGWILVADENNMVGLGGEMMRYFSREATDAGADPKTKPTLVVVYHE